MTDPKLALDYAGHMAQMLDTEALRQIILHCRSAQAMLREAVAQEAIDNALDGLGAAAMEDDLPEGLGI